MRTSSRAGLDWLNFFVANLQTAFGPFIAVYLTSQHWTQGQIGVALSIGTITAMASQVPAGAVVDMLPNKRMAAFWAIVAIMLSCLLLALLPQQLPVAAAEVLHGFASCMLNPAIAAITLGVVAAQLKGQPDPGDGGLAALGQRLGRNSSFASIGNAFAAGLMGGVGYLLSAQATFFLGAALAAPGLLALRMIGRGGDAAPASDDASREPAVAEAGHPHGGVLALLRSRKLLGFLICTVFYYLSNAAMLPLAAGQITKQAGGEAELIIAACILLPQLIVAVLSPQVGRYAGIVGMRPIMLIGFAALPIRGVLLALSTDPFLVVAFELLDGISSAVFGVMLPLAAADISRGTGRFNLCMGILGLGMGLGATFSTTIAGYAADSSLPLAFLTLTAAGLISVALVWLLPGERLSLGWILRAIRRKAVPATMAPAGSSPEGRRD